MAGTGAVTNDELNNPESTGFNPFVCNVCQKTYGRIDHLARHFRSHTNEKPFKCPDCGKAFARADLLKRHGNLHIPTDPSGKRRKIRASQACTACASIKVKCDHEKPCKRCRLKSLECRVEPANSSRARADSGSCSDGMSPTPQHRNQRDSPNTVVTDRTPAGASSVLTPTSADEIPGHPLQLAYTTPRSIDQLPSMDNPSLGDFLRDVFHPDSKTNMPITYAEGMTMWNQDDLYNSRDLLDFSQEFGMGYGNLNEVLGSDWDNWFYPIAAPQHNVNGSPGSNAASIQDSINLGSAAFERSAWRWVPGQGEGIDDHSNLASMLTEPTSDGELPSSVPGYHMVQPLDPSQRDSIIALLFNVCEKVSYQKIMTQFPSPKVLDIFLNDYLLTNEHSIDSWIHIPSLSLNNILPEFLALLVAGGATLGPTAHAQRFGYTLQELMRLALPGMFEKDNSKTRHLQALQAFAVCLDIGTWSGNKRTMELAESQVSPLITMLRRSGRFHRPHGHLLGPSFDDSQQQLEAKWHAWIEAESFKRLAYHVFLYSVQVSIAFQTPPLVSYAEITLELPAPQKLWRAKTAVEWRNQYIAHDSSVHLPSFVMSMRDAQIMGSVRHQIDLELSLYLILLSHWGLAWEFMQMSAANRLQECADIQWAGTFLASSKCQEIRNLLDSFYVEIESWNIVVPKEVHMISQLLRMNLCVTFGDLQILAGKDGAEEARHILPVLKRWYHSPDCRQAIWHAGQTLRAARRPAWRSLDKASCAPVPTTPWLRDFNAVVLYHAGLALWVYGLLSRSIAADNTEGTMPQTDMNYHDGSSTIPFGDQFVYLDRDENASQMDWRRFIGMNHGRPVLSTVGENWSEHNAITAAAQTLTSPQSIDGDPMQISEERLDEAIFLDDTRQVMEVLIQALSPPSHRSYDVNRSNHGSFYPQRPAMVENLIQLLQDLGEAASVV